MGHLNSANKDDAAPAYAGDNIVSADAGETSNDEQRIPAWKAYLSRMGSGMGQPISQKPSWATMGAGIATAIGKKFRPEE